jgi:hypothetical protein
MAISKIETASLDAGLVAPSATTATTATSLTTASGSAPSYSARAWVNFNGAGTVAIRASGNVTSITDNGTGDYTANFTTAMADANYAVSIASSPNYGVNIGNFNQAASTGTTSEIAPTTSAFRFGVLGQNTNAFDSKYISVAVFR